MKRQVKRIIILLIVGALITTIVAWRNANVRAGTEAFTYIDGADARHLLQRYGKRLLDDAEVAALRAEPVGFDEIRIYETAGLETGPFEVHIWTVCRAGWPCRALEGVIHRYESRSRQWGESKWSIILPRWAWPVGWWALPMRPRPLGFAVNTVFYATMMGGLVMVAASVRRRARLDRGECPRCRYSLRGVVPGEASRCSECGQVLRAGVLSRPRQIPRPWMVPFLVPAVVVLTFWFQGTMTWPRTRFQMQYLQEFPTVHMICTLAVAAIWIAALVMVGCRDRTAWRRLTIGLVLGLVLAAVAYVPLLAIGAHLIGS